MNNTKRFYKRLLDISLLVSYFLVIILVFLMVFSISVGALNFNDSTGSIIVEKYSYLKPIYIAIIVGIVVFVITSRVFLQFISNTEKLETAADYRRNKSKSINKAEQKRLKKKRLKEKELLLASKKRKRQTSVPSVVDEQVTKGTAIGTLIKDVGSIKQTEEPKPIEIANPMDIAESKEYYTRLNKSELIEIISKVLGTSISKSKKFVNGLFNIIKEELIQGNEVKIDDFGKFSTNLVKERKGVNPKNGKTLSISEHKAVKFTPYKKFKDDITNDVVATGERFLFTRTSAKNLDEDRVADELEKERIARDHIEDVVTKPSAIEHEKSTKIKKAKPINVKKAKKVKPIKIKKEKKVKPKKEKKAKPVKKEEVKPTKIEETKPIKVKKAKPMKVKEQKPVKTEEPKLTKTKKAKPIKAKETKPVKTDEPKPIKTKKAKPIKAKETKPVKTDEPKPIKTKKAKPIKAKESKPVKIEETKPIKTEKAKPIIIAKTKAKVPKKTKKDIIEYIDSRTDLSKNKANKFLQTFADVMKAELSKNKDIDIKGFGKFTTILIPAKDAVNPSTNEKIVVPEHKQVRLRFEEEFKSIFK